MNESMASFRAESASDPSSRVEKPPSGDLAPSGSAPSAEPNAAAGESPTVLSSLKPPSSLHPEPTAMVARELAGEMLAHFRLDDYVGVGGMGAVFRATDIRLDRPVALKVLPPEQAKDAEVVARFKQEARAAARLDHENIAHVYFVGEDRGLHFIAFEFVDGVNVRDLIQQCGPLPPADAVNYAIQITGALVHAATRAVVHRDIKPSNIIITDTGRAKLVDMGLARSFERRRDGGLTQSGVTLGTFDYISPEQATDPRLADIRSDIYSLGCTLFHMLAGRPPYPEGTVLQKLLKHQRDTPPNARDLNPNVPADLAAVVERMMAKDPSRRFQTPGELLGALLEIAANLGLQSTTPEGLIWVSQQPRPTMTWTASAVWLVAAAVLVGTVIALYGWPLGSADETPHRTRIAASRDSLTAPTGDRMPPVSDASDRPGTASLIGDEPRGDDRDASERAASESPPSGSGRGQPADRAASEARVLMVTNDRELRDAIEQSPSGSIIELDGQFRPQVLRRTDDTAGLRIENKRLTLRAAAGASPRIELRFDERVEDAADWTLLSLVAAQVELEGIQFELDVAGGSAPMAILACEQSQVTARRCRFAEVGVPSAALRAGECPVWVARLDSAIGLDGQARASSLLAEESFFAGGAGAFALDGPARLELRECVLLPYRSTVWVRSLGFPPSLAADIRLDRVSLFGSGNAVFDLRFAAAVVRARNSAFSHEPPARGVLASADSESRLEWDGRRNLYHGVRDYLVSVSDNNTRTLAHTLAEWTDPALDLDVIEEESTESDRSPWLISLRQASLGDDKGVVDAFRIAKTAGDPAWWPVGARVVAPWGPLYPSMQQESTGLPLNSVASTRDAADAAGESGADRRSPPADAGAASPRPGDRSEATAARRSDAQAGVASTVPSRADAPQSGASSNANNPPDANSARTPAVAGGPLVVDPSGGTPFQSLAAAVARAQDGDVIEVRHTGTLREKPIELGDRNLTFRAAAGWRPTIELVVDRLGLKGLEPRLFYVGRGSLVLRDLDLRVVVDSQVSPGTWSVIVSRGADVTVDGCTVSVETPAGMATALVQFVARDEMDPMMATMAALPNQASFQLRNSLVAGVGTVTLLRPGVLVRSAMENCAVEVHESVLETTGGAERLTPGAMNELSLQHCTIRTHRYLAWCEASETRAFIPSLKITASDNVIAGDSNSPWLRFKSPRPASEIYAQLRWRGTNNWYHGLETFWFIESMGGTGESLTYKWDNWASPPDREEIKGDRRPLEFAQPTDTDALSPRTRDHFRLKASSPSDATSMNDRGADLTLIPEPPRAR